MKQLSLLFLVNGERILLAMKKRGFGEGLFNGVGGKQNDGEAIEHTAIRECQEEIGVTPLNFKRMAELVFVDYLGDEIKVIVFICDEWEGEPIESEEMRPKWFNMSKIPFKHMWQDDQYWLPMVLKGQKVTGRFIFSQANRLVDWQLNVCDEL